MKNERMRPDWENRGFVFWCKPETKETIAAFDEEFKRARMLWNALTEANQNAFKERNELLRKDPTVNTLETMCSKKEELFLSALEAFKTAKMNHEDELRWKKIKDRAYKELSDIRQEIKKARRLAAKNGLKKECEELSKKQHQTFYLNKDNEILKSFEFNTNNTGGAIFKSFNQTRENLFKGIGGIPRFKSFKDSISIKIANNSGGWPVSDFFDMNSRLFSLKRPNEKGRTSFLWGINGTLHKFRMVMHRPFPKNCFIKGIRLKKQDKRYQIAFDIEEPPKKKLNHGKSTIIISPRWTKTDLKTDLLVGSISILRKRIKRQTRGKAVKITDNQLIPIRLFESDIFHPQKTNTDIFARIKHMDRLQNEASLVLDSVKVKCLEHKRELEKLEGWGGNITLSGRRGLGRLLNILEKKETSICPAIFDLRKGLKIYDSKMTEKNGIERRIARYRDWFYWNLSKWIAERAEVVIWKDTDLKSLGRKKDLEDLPEDIASVIRRQKRFAAPGDFLEKLKKQCFKHGVEVLIQSPE